MSETLTAKPPTPLERVQALLRERNWQALIVPSTDEFLSEFAPPAAQRLRWVTGFRGSTGLAILLQDRAALFLDGRYRAQGREDTVGGGIEIQDAAERCRFEWMAEHLGAGARLVLNTGLQPFADVTRLLEWAHDRHIEVVELAENPIDEVWGSERPAGQASLVMDYPVHFAGDSAADKWAQLQAWMYEAGLDGYLLADPEDVAWLLNVRTQEARTIRPGAWHIVPHSLEPGAGG